MQIINSFANNVSMDGRERIWEVTSVHDTVHEIRLHVRQHLGTKSMFHWSRAWREEDCVVRRMARLKRASQRLGREEFEMRLDRKDAGLDVEVLNR